MKIEPIVLEPKPGETNEEFLLRAVMEAWKVAQ